MAPFAPLSNAQKNLMIKNMKTPVIPGTGTKEHIPQEFVMKVVLYPYSVKLELFVSNREKSIIQYC